MPLEFSVGGFARHLRAGDLGARVLLVEALLRGQLGRRGDRQVAGVLVPLAWTSGEDRKLRKAATPLVLLGSCPAITQSEAPPMIVFCGAPSTAVQ
jgi:hypothetical protein